MALAALLIADPIPDAGAATGTLAGALIGLVSLIVSVGKWWIERQRARDMAAVDNPVAPMPVAPPVPALAPIPAAETLQLDTSRVHVPLEAARAMAEWSLSEARARVRELEKEVYRLQLAMSEERMERERLESQMGKLREERESAAARARQLADELQAVRDAISSGHSTRGINTPVVPAHGRLIKPRGDR